nr:ChaN family lipoprotein [Acidobacteriota bacterium]
TASRTFVDFETMLVAISKVDFVFVGEQHDDPATHRLEAAILDGLHRRKVAPILSLEMFERDGQSGLDAYLAGRLTEDDMLKVSRPWPRYRQDYRAMVEMAKQRGWSVIAANVPRRIASAVAKFGNEAVAALPETDRPLVARDLQCPLDGYFDRFVQTMTGHPAGAQTPEQQRATTERYYWAQCVKDETMAESIASAFERRAAGQGPVVHYNGAFHSDFGLGTAERVRRRLPGRRSIVVAMLPVGDLDAVAPAGDELNRAHYLVYTVK